MKRPHLTAWLIVVTSFLCFALVCSATGIGVYWFFFDSPVQLISSLTVSRGIVRLQTLSESLLVDDAHSIDQHTAISVNEGAQAILAFRDTYSDQVVASITITENSSVIVTEATRPRFEVSRHPYSIILERAVGQFIVNATPRSRAFVFDLNSDIGTAHLTDDGRYTIVAGPDEMVQSDRALQLFNQGGKALLYLQPSREGRDIYPNQIGHAWGEQIMTTDSPFKILAEGIFESAQPIDIHSLPPNWEWQNGSDPAEPSGFWLRDPDMGYALRLQRGDASFTTHGETSVFIFPNRPDGIDTSRYQSIRLQMWIQLVSQNIPVCGVKGSECPVMVELAYQSPSDDPDSLPHKWNHGFYFTANAASPQTCDTCRVAHERLNPGVWYFYDSGDLKAQLGDPAPIIKRLSVYSSGHQYNVLISQVALVGIPRQ